MEKKIPILLQDVLNKDEKYDILQLKGSKGWKYIEEYMENRILYYQNKLQTEKFKELNEVYKYQAIIETFNNIKVLIDKQL